MNRPPAAAYSRRSIRPERRVAIVGNAPEVGDRAREIDTADIVVRFNNTHGLGAETGAKTTYLFLINCGGQMHEWLDDPAFGRRPAVRDADAIYLPIDPAHIDAFDPPATARERAGAAAEDHTAEAMAALSRAGKRVELLPARHFAAACADLGTRLRVGMPPPSTGYLATRYLVETLGRAGCRIECYGFGFEGFEAHAWSAERRWFERQRREGRLSLAPLLEAREAA